MQDLSVFWCLESVRNACDWNVTQGLYFSSADEPAQPAPSDQPPSPPSEPNPKPSKRLIILAECKWASDADRNHVLKKLCEAMAQDRLDDPFWIRKYLISPISQTVEESGSDRCIQYKIHISRPRVEREKAAAPPKPQQQGNKRKENPQQQVGKNINTGLSFFYTTYNNTTKLWTHLPLVFTWNLKENQSATNLLIS